MEPIVGGCASLLISFILAKTASLVAADTIIFGLPIWKVALTIHVCAWILQFIGHGVFEGKEDTFRFRFLQTNLNTTKQDI